MNCNHGRTCDCVADEEYASSTVPPTTVNSWEQTDWDRYYMQKARDAQNSPLPGWERSAEKEITMEDDPVRELLHDVQRYVVNALAGIGILATIVFIGMVSAGYFGK